MNPRSSLTESAARCGIADALLFRRLSASTWAHLGGLGRGRGWAGVVDVSSTDDPLMSEVPASAGGVRRFRYENAERVLGPYYAVGGAMVRVNNDVLVVFGHPTEPISETTSDQTLRDLAGELDRGIEDVGPPKRLADELEVLHAVRAVTTADQDDLASTLRHIVEVAAASLSCEIGLLRDGAGRMAAWTPSVDLDSGADVPAGLTTALDFLQQQATGGLHCVQDARTVPALGWLTEHGDVRSVLTVDIPPPVGGILVVAHTEAGPRGFTGLCQQLGRHVADAAGIVANTAALRDELRASAFEHARMARQDPLTGLGNRLAWDEAVVEAQQQVDTGGQFTVLILDLDGLKQVNDTLGHDAGDRLLRRCADVLRSQHRPEDICVRLGGDEFAVLIPDGPESSRQRVASLTDRLASGDQQRS